MASKWVKHMWPGIPHLIGNDKKTQMLIAPCKQSDCSKHMYNPYWIYDYGYAKWLKSVPRLECILFLLHQRTATQPHPLEVLQQQPYWYQIFQKVPSLLPKTPLLQQHLRDCKELPAKGPTQTPYSLIGKDSNNMFWWTTAFWVGRLHMACCSPCFIAISWRVRNHEPMACEQNIQTRKEHKLRHSRRLKRRKQHETTKSWTFRSKPRMVRICQNWPLFKWNRL